MSSNDLFQNVRDACSSSQWSRGVELARSDAVSGESEGRDEIAVRVSTRGGLISPSVRLYPEDGDWECECASHDDACEHVAAAVIALRQNGGRLAKPANGPGRIGYRLTRCPGGLALERVVVGSDHPEPLGSTLAAVASGRVDGPPFVATSADLEIERSLGARLRGPLPRGLMAGLLDRLVDCPDVQLDGRSVKTSRERLVPRVRLVDDAEGVRLLLERDPDVTEVLDGGVVLCGDTLRARGETRLTGREIDQLSRGSCFGPEQVAELVTEILPSLRERVPVSIETRRLPRTVSAEPRVRVEVRRENDRLSILPTLVYGDPALARVDAGRLVPFGDSVPLRDEAAERRAVRRLQGELELLPGRRLRLAGEDAVRFAERLRSWRGEILGNAHEAFFRADALTPHLEVGDSGFSLWFSSPGASEKVAPEPVLRAWREGISLAPLAGGGFAPLPEDWLERFGHRIADLLGARDGRKQLPRSALPDLARLCDELGRPRPADYEGLRELVEGSEEIPGAELDSKLAGWLRRYQRHGVDWLCLLRRAGLGALLADDMGLGKTLQALCALQGRTLVVAPTSVLHNWANEIQRFRPELRVSLYHGPGRRLDPKAQVTLTTYAILRLDAGALAAEDWGTLILDEAQAIKNPDSQVARAAHRLHAEFRMALSGTPVENRLAELWSIFQALNPGLLGSRRDFEERYARPISLGDSESAERLRERLRPFVLRRLKRDVAPELPPRTDIVLRAELEPSEREVYDAIRAATRHDVVARLTTGGGVLQALEALLRLRQACCHPALVPGQSAEGSSKTTLLVELLEEAVADGHKALVFSQWTSLLDLVEPMLQKVSIGFTRLDGSTRDRGAVVASFQDEAGPPVLLASLKAGGLGLNLTAADSVFILDPWWNPAAEDQAADRAHRIGQTRPVTVYRLVARDTVEERILALQDAKRELADAALGAAERAGGISREDLLTLLA